MGSEGLRCRMRAERKKADGDGEVPLVSQRALNPLFTVEKRTRDIQVFVEDVFSLQPEYLHHIDF